VLELVEMVKREQLAVLACEREAKCGESNAARDRDRRR